MLYGFTLFKSGGMNELGSIVLRFNDILSRLGEVERVIEDQHVQIQEENVVLAQMLDETNKGKEQRELFH